MSREERIKLRRKIAEKIFLQSLTICMDVGLNKSDVKSLSKDSINVAEEFINNLIAYERIH